MRPTRWRVPLVLSTIVVAAVLAHTSPLVDVVTGQVPAGLSLSYPALHVVLAPYTLLADWLNSESRQNIIGFLVWAALLWVLIRLASGSRGWAREVARSAGFLAGVAALFALVAFVDRPIPRLVVDRTALPDALVWDSHSHSAASHDGRKGFDAFANARWHARAGFDAAFLTDHNVYGAIRAWRAGGVGLAVMGQLQPAQVDPRWQRLLDGEELSLSGLHLVVLGTRTQLANAPANRSWDSTLALVRRLAPPGADTLFLVASLPEYWQHHWNDGLRELVMAGVRGFEIWTSSPGGMAIPDAQRGTVIARARLSKLAVLGATDMHGLGRTASVWNVMDLPGWRTMSEPQLEKALIGQLAREGFQANRVIAMRRATPASRLARAFAVPVGLFGALRRASPAHAAALLVWTWIPFLAISFRRRRPTP